MSWSARDARRLFMVHCYAPCAMRLPPCYAAPDITSFTLIDVDTPFSFRLMPACCRRCCHDYDILPLCRLRRLMDTL